MANQANVLVSSVVDTIAKTSSATIGADVTFAPEDRRDGIARYVNRASGVYLGYDSLSIAVRPPTKDGYITKVSCKLVQPILETIDPAVGIFGPRRAYQNEAHMDFLMHARSTAAEKALFLSYVKSLFFVGIIANDGDPYTAAAGSPLVPAILTGESVY